VADDLDDAAGLLWDQAQRQLSQQISDLATLRTRAVALLSVAALVAGLFGSRLPHGHASAIRVTAVTVALALFAIGVVLALLVAAPRSQWIFDFKLDKLAELVNDGSAVPRDITSNLAEWADDALRWNAGKLEKLYVLFGCLCAVVGLEVVAWAVAAL